MPKLRRDAARLFRKGWSARKVGRYLGYHHTAVMRWVRKASVIGDHPIPTMSSEPKTFRNPTALDIVKRICGMRIETKRCGLAIYEQLKREGVVIGKNTVHRILDRARLLNKRSPYWRYHPPVERPKALHSGDLVEMDSIHLMISEKKRIYVLVLIDIYSRWAYARCFEKMNAARTVVFFRQALRDAPFPFRMIQTDHGPEFGQWFVRKINVSHRHTRIGKPNDNAHMERFNRTLQDELVRSLPTDVDTINRALPKYLSYYNGKRHHFGLNLKTPLQVMRSY